MAESGAHPRLADHLASFGREPDAERMPNDGQMNVKRNTKRPGTEVDLTQFGLNR